MKQSQLFLKTLKEAPKDAEAISHKLLVRAGFIDQLTAGVYTFLPLGFRVLKKIENIIREEMEAVGGQEILMPALNPKENWQQTGRWEKLDILFKLKGAADKEYALSPTHEEIVAPLAKKFIFSYKDLPLYLFHIQTKFRNELRVKSGLLRTREFLMKDLYSFHISQEDLDAYYEKVVKAYIRIYKRCGLGAKTYLTLASGGTFSKYSHEFQTLAEAGEDIIHICRKCKLAINEDIKAETKECPECGGTDFVRAKASEVGNIFKLGTRYSEPFNLKFRDRNGKEQPVIMGCYGIGLGRLMAVAVEVSNDERGIIWPKEIAPFQAHLLQLENSPKANQSSKKIYADLQKEKVEVLYDDRQDKTAGEKFADSDLIGIPMRIVVSKKTLVKNCVEIKERGKEKAKLVKIKEVFDYVK